MFLNVILTIVLTIPMIVMFKKRQFSWKSFLLFVLSMTNALSQFFLPAVVASSEHPVLTLLWSFLSYGFWLAINLMATFN